MKNNETHEKQEPRERSGNYRIVKICLHEIEAMKELGFSRKTILERLESYFGNRLTPDQLSSNINRIRKEVEDKELRTPGKSKIRKDRIAEIVKNPELIHGNLNIYQQIINPKAEGTPAHTSARRISPAPPRKSTPEPQRRPQHPKTESEEIEAIWKGVLTYINRTNTKYREEDVPHIKEILARNLSSLQGKVPLEIIEEHLRSFFN